MNVSSIARNQAGIRSGLLAGTGIGTTDVAASAVRVDAGLALLRGVAGLVFMLHGGQKLFVYGIEGVSGAFAGMGVPLAGVVGPGVGLVELLGGIALIFGLLTRLASAGLAMIMLGAIFLVHLPAGFFLPNGYEFVLTLLAISGAIALIGPGSYSLDSVLARRRG